MFYTRLQIYNSINVWPELHTNVHILGVGLGTGIRGVQNSMKHSSTFVMKCSARSSST